MIRIVVCLVIALACFSCKDDPIPKPSALLRLEYPAPQYQRTSVDLPFTFEKNNLADSIGNIRVLSETSKGIELVYPVMKGTIYLTYKTVTDSNLRDLLMDAQNITQKHTVKADEIVEQPYLDEQNRVYGMFYEVGGNAASQSQFYVTDSTRHFIQGSLYFYAKPNYDSILPAAYYLRNDIKQIMETIRWEE